MPEGDPPRGERSLVKAGLGLVWLKILPIAHLLRWHYLNYKALLMYIDSLLGGSGWAKEEEQEQLKPTKVTKEKNLQLCGRQ